MTAPLAERTGIPVLVSFPLALGVLVTVAGLFSRAARLRDPDVMLHTVVGRWIVEHHGVPHADPFSFTMPGAPWVAHEWLGEVIISGFYAALGWQGMVAMASLAMGLAVALFTRALLRNYQPAHAIIIAALAWLVVTPHWLARPHIIALPLTVLWMTLLVAARQDGRAPHPAWALLMIPWVNLHGSFLVGIGFAGLFLVEAILVTSGEAARLKQAKDWAIFCALAVLASLVTPYGIEAYRLPFKLLDMKFTLSVLSEWKAINFQVLSTFEIWFLIFLGAVLGCGIKLPWTRMLMAVLLFDMALKHARHAELMAFLVPLLAGPWAGMQMRPAAAPHKVSRVERMFERMAQPASWRGIALAGAVLVAAEAVAAAFPFTPGDQYMPAAALGAVRQHGVSGPVLNEYDYGDYLIFSGVKPFIDGRADMYGDTFIKRFYEATRGQSDELPKLLEEYHIDWTLFPKDSPALVQLDRMAGWHRLYGDDVAVVHVRDGAASH